MKKFNFSLLTLFFISFSSILSAQYADIKFEHYTTDNGLTQNSIYDIVQDKNGFLWFGTQSGLNRFDGYNFTRYIFNADDSCSISNANIYCLYTDNASSLWVGTSNGLNIFDLKTNCFKAYFNEKNNINSLSHNAVTSICSDNKGIYWIGTEQGLNKFNQKNESFVRYLQSEFNTMRSNNITKLYYTEDEKLIIGFDKGLCLYDESQNKFHEISIKGLNNQDLYITSIIEMPKGTLWIGTRGVGLIKLDIRTWDAKIYSESDNDPNGITNNYITDIIKGERGLWIATFDGLRFFDLVNQKFYAHRNNTSSSESISSNNLQTLFIDHSGVLWVGTRSQGIDRAFNIKNNFIRVYNNPNDPNSLSNNEVFSICEDYDGNYWSASLLGLNYIDKKTLKCKIYRHDPKDKNSILSDRVWAVLRTKDNEIWVGTHYGISIYNREKDNFTPLLIDKENPHSLRNKLNSFYQDSKGYVWACTYHGLYRINPETHEIKTFENEPDNENSINANKVWFIYEDSLHNYWIGTAFGLNYYNPTKDTFKKYTQNNEQYSLPSNYIYAVTIDKKKRLWFAAESGAIILENGKFISVPLEIGNFQCAAYGITCDKNGNIWLGTNKGLTFVNSQSMNMKFFSSKDGAQSEYNDALYLSSGGKVLAGGIEGISIFNPDDIVENKIPPKIVFTKLKILNREISINKEYDERIILKKSLNNTDILNLSYKDYTFSIEFAALHYSDPQNNIYRYKLEGLDTSWFQVDAENRVVSYTNLDPKSYTFKLQAANSDGVWSDITREIKINIKPPFWKTLWFKILVPLILFITVLLIIYLRFRRLKNQKEKLEKLVFERTEELMDANTALEEQQAELEQKQEEIIAQNEVLESQKIEIQNQNEELNKLSLVASETDNAVFILDANANLEWANLGFTKLTGYTLDEFTEKYGKNIKKISSNSAISELVDTCISEKTSVKYESKIDTNNNNTLYMQTTLTPILNEKGEVDKLIAIDSDITKIKEAEALIIKQKNKVEEQNAFIHGSIKYARTIQQAILPVKEQMNKHFDTFVLYLPKDIVSGDFYWYTKVENSNHIFISVIDCTGHGVPGAFMSLIGNRLLNEIINEKGIYTPSKILEALDLNVNKALKQDYSDNNDGMDLCLCRLTKQADNSYELLYSGAKRPIYIYSSGEENIEIIKGDRKSIGGIKRKNGVKFTDNLKIVDKNDILYLSTDGMIDQNDSSRKRYGSMRFQKLLNQIKLLPIEQQKIKIKHELEHYMKNESQRDDITVLGVKIK